MCSPRVIGQVYRALAQTRDRLPLPIHTPAGGTHTITAENTARTFTPQHATAVVDLTHVLSPDFPVWPGDKPFAMQTASLIESGFATHELSFNEHVGTHIDAPAHAAADGSTVEQIRPEDLVAPIAVIDISERAAEDNDTLLSIDDIVRWERRHGPLPSRCLVAMNSGWDARAAHPDSGQFPNPCANPSPFANPDESGILHSPGFDPEAVRFLVAERDIVGIASDTLSIDGGATDTYGAHYAALGSGKYGVEAVAHLSLIPQAGATVVVGAPTHRGGSGGPCRMLAFT